MDFDSFQDLLSRQRAIRAFDISRTVDDALIERALRVATFAPSGGNRQPWSFVVIRDAAIKVKLQAIYDEMVQQYLNGRPATGQTPWSEAPVLIAVCAPGSRAPGGSVVAPSIYPAVQNLLLGLHALGLGSVLTTLWKGREAEVKAILDVPEDIEIHAILPVGWPDRAYGRGKRKPVSEVAYRDRYGASW